MTLKGALGEEWKDCFLEFEPVTMAEAEELSKLPEEDLKSAEKVFVILQDKYVSGQVLNEQGEKEELPKEDLKQLPLFVVEEVVHFLSHNHPKNN